jgi:hypothetical protein
MDLAEQKVIAILPWTIATLITKPERKEKKRVFSQGVKIEVSHKQKGKCTICKTKLQTIWTRFPP